MKFKILYHNGMIEYFYAKEYSECVNILNKRNHKWKKISVVNIPVVRKSDTLNKRTYVKKSDKIYDRNKEKRNFKKETEDA